MRNKRRPGVRAAGFLLAAVMGFSLISVGPAYAAGGNESNATTGELVTNSGFESSDLSGWNNNGISTLSSTTEASHSGSRSLKVEKIGSTWMGPLYNLLTPVQYHHTYQVSLYLKGAQSAATTESVLVHRVDKNGVGYDMSIAQDVSISAKEWTKVTGQFTLTEKKEEVTTLGLMFRSKDASKNYYVDDISIKEISQTNGVQTNLTPLKSKYDFTMGCAAVYSDLIDDHAQLLTHHFDSLTAGNEMKASSLYNSKHELDFTTADKFVDFAIANNMKLRGHNLVWQSQVPDWWFTTNLSDPDNPKYFVSKEQLLKTMKTHITSVLQHFKQKYGSKSPFYCWDVVNEPISNSHQNNGIKGLDEGSKWEAIIGPEYIDYALRYAHEADPDIKLFINDYGIVNDGQKTTDLYNEAKKLLQAGVPLDGIGLQMHIDVDSPSISSIKDAIEKFGSLGLEVQVTELDVSTGGKTDAVTLAKAARRYKQLFDLFESEKKYIKVVTVWGSADDGSWLGANNSPMLFDTALQAKPAFNALVQAAGTPVVPTSAKSCQGNPTADSALWSTVSAWSTDTFIKGTGGATAAVKTMWDSKNLYVQADVTDSTRSAKDGITLYLNNNGVKAYPITLSNSGGKLKAAVQKTDTGYTVSAAIPIQNLKPAVGGQLQFDVQVLDYNAKNALTSIATWSDFQNTQSKSTANYGKLELSASANLAKAVYGTPVVDGKEDAAWQKAPAFDTATWVTGKSGATAKVQTMWDQKNLYVLYHVTDSVLNSSNANAWEQDSIETFLDVNNHKSPAYESDDGQYRVSYKNAKSGGGAASADLNAWTSATSKTDTGYLVEMAIPLTSITPANGTMLGFDAQVNDADASGARTGVVTWSDSTGKSYTDTSHFGNLELVGGPASSQFVSDTTKDITVKSAYQFRITVKNGAYPNFVVGTAGVFRTQLVKKSGSDYFIKIFTVGKSGAKAGIYVNGVKVSVATVR